MKIVYSYYVLDIIHKGHLLMMKNSKAMAGKDGKLIVGILTEKAVLEKKKNPPVLSLDERIDIAESIKYVDVAVAQEPGPTERTVEANFGEQHNTFE